MELPLPLGETKTSKLNPAAVEYVPLKQQHSASNSTAVKSKSHPPPVKTAMPPKAKSPPAMDAHTKRVPHPLPARPPPQAKYQIFLKGASQTIEPNLPARPQKIGEQKPTDRLPAAPSAAFQTRRHDATESKKKKKSRWGWQCKVDNLSTPGAVGRVRNLSRPLSGFEKLRLGARASGCLHSPFLPQTSKELANHKRNRRCKNLLKHVKRKLAQRDAAKCPAVENSGRDCMGAKVFETNHSCVLSCRTIWCPESWRDYRQLAKWPTTEDFIAYGANRSRSDLGQNTPVPQSEERLAVTRGELDRIVGAGTSNGEECLFDRAQEISFEDASGLIGEDLWKEINEDEEDRFDKAVKINQESVKTFHGGYKKGGRRMSKALKL